MAIDMTKYYRVDLENVQSTNSGGRAFSVEHTAELPNGILGYLGGKVSGKPSIRSYAAPTAALIKAKMPLIIAKPEIPYDQSTSEKGALGKFRNPANKAFPMYELKEYDEVAFSADYFSGKTGAIAVNDCFTISTDGLLVHAATPSNTTDKVCFKVVEIKKSHTPAFIGSTGSFFPATYDLIVCSVELV